MKILITGGAGFIGSAVCRYLIEHSDHEVINLDALTYAGDLSTVEVIAHNKRYNFEHANICDSDALDRIFRTYHPDAVMHLAAESHVDRSIEGPAAFIQTNIVGTYRLLYSAMQYWQELGQNEQKRFRFVHISTDEVYGSLGNTGAFSEETPYKPNSPYSASKASSDHLVRAWFHTYGFPVITSNCSNNYGPYQFPEKLIPVLIMNAINGHPLPIYGKGQNVRDWLHVDDHARALYTILTKGRPGEKYNVGGNAEMMNIDIAKLICAILDELKPNSSLTSYEQLITYVQDRPGHDMRYAVDTQKIQNDLGWAPEETLNTGLKKTVEWYLNNLDWVQTIASGAYLERRGIQTFS